MPKRAIPYLAGLLALAVAGILITPSICAPRVTPENYEKIREGMQLADVEAILGAPQMRGIRAAWHMDMNTVESLHPVFSPEKEVAEAIRWQDGGGLIIVGFLADGDVAFKRYDPFPGPSFGEKLHRWLLRM